jgi:LPXTG-motif cell wall-anchored protein
MTDVKTSYIPSMLRTPETVPYKESRTPGPGHTSRTRLNLIPALFVILISAAAVLFFVVPAAALPTSQEAKEAGKVYVSGVSLEPGTLFSGDTCTITYSVTNGNQNDSVAVNHAIFDGSKDVSLTSDNYVTNMNIGPLQTRPFIFQVTSDKADGSYFPRFSLSFRDADSLYYSTQVKIDNTPLILTVLDKPDTFTQDKKETIQLQVANPRQNDVKNVVVKVSGDGIAATPSEKYIGKLAAGTAANLSVAVTPSSETSMKLLVTYDNGDNHHSIEKTLPVTFGLDKKKAAPQLSNIKVTLENGVYHVTGDITNAGLTTANGVTVAAASPAVPEDPYQSYIIGALKPDDFGSFEVTFRADGLSSIPLQISYKDADGNIVTTQKLVSLSNAATSSASSTGNNPLLVPAIGLIVVILAAGGYVYYKRKNTKQ